MLHYHTDGLLKFVFVKDHKLHFVGEEKNQRNIFENECCNKS